MVDPVNKFLELKIIKKKKHRDLHKKLHRICPDDLETKRYQKKEKRICQKIFYLKSQLGLIKTTRPHLVSIQSTNWMKEDIQQINSMDQSIALVDSTIDTLDSEINPMKQKLWKLSKNICELKHSLKSNNQQAIKPPTQPQQVPKFSDSTHRPIIIIGDWSKGKQLNGIISTPNMRLKRRLARAFPLYMIDEYRTSCLHYLTEQRCSNLSLPDATGKLREIHAVLTYQTETNGLACINRDNNGCRNIRKMFNYYMTTGERPYRYQRGVDI